MARFPSLPMAAVAFLLLFGGFSCADVEPVVTADGGTSGDINAKFVCADPGADPDGDKVPSREEGCLGGVDADGDGVPDWQDKDSDGDGIPDAVEAGRKDGAGACAAGGAWPCDSDGDKVPDLRDTDSDGDTLLDGDEDPSGDGLVGCCLTTCNQPDAAWQQAHCTLGSGGCGAGQTCQAGACTPAKDFRCSHGETSTRTRQTFAGGPADPGLGFHVCRDASAKNPGGRAQVTLRSDKALDWTVALDPAAAYQRLSVNSAAAGEGAAAIDHSAATATLAGFVSSSSPTKTDIQSEQVALLGRLKAALSGATVTIRASGTLTRTHDRYPAVVGTTLDIAVPKKTDVAALRAEVIAALLGRKAADLGNLPAGFGAPDSAFVLRMTAVWRHEFKKDASGKVVTDAGGAPLDSGDASKRRVLVVGAVAQKTHYQDPKRRTGFLVDDLSGSATLARADATLLDACDTHRFPGPAMADIIWVVDESESMRTHSPVVVNNANNLFSRALASGLDFRMGVTGVGAAASGLAGKFCSKISTNPADDGGSDRFLLPTEQTIFSACIKNPPGKPTAEYGLVNAREAVKTHLPRAASSPKAIRKGATLVLIVASDEPSSPVLAALSACGTTTTCTCPLAATQQAKVDAAIKPYLDYFSGLADPEATAVLHYIGKPCHHTCGSKTLPGYGYEGLARQLGGQSMDICQKDLGPSLQVVIDAVAAGDSPFKLSHVPVPGTIAVNLDGADLKRSRTGGFDYRISANALVLINVKYSKSARAVAGYSTWSTPGL